MRIILAIDILDGKCVRLEKGDYERKQHYSEDPLVIAKKFEDHGIRYLHLVDLDGARSGQIVNVAVLEKIASNTNLILDFGGGIKSEEDLRIAFDAGAQMITAGSVAVTNEVMVLEWLGKYGNEKIILGADCRDRMISTMGWTENSETDVIDFISKYEERGIRTVICTDISKDGMLLGPSTELYEEILEQTNVELIASGGVSTLEDIEKLKNIGCEGAIIGKAIYEGKIKLNELSDLC